MQTKVLLSWVVQHLSKTAADANERLLLDYVVTAKKLTESENDLISDFITLSPPLVISNMKMKFSANVSRSGKASLGDDMMLEFDKPANFHGEIELTPFRSNSLEVRQNHSGQADDVSDVKQGENNYHHGDSGFSFGDLVSTDNNDEIL